MRKRLMDRPAGRLRILACAAVLAMLSGCAAQPASAPAGDDRGPPPGAAGASAAPAAKGAAALAAAGPSAAGVGVAGASSDELGAPFETKYARFEPQPFSQVPGWADDSQAEGLSAFRQSCTALRKKPVWTELCARSDQLDPQQALAWRGFFEQNFRAYSVQQLDRSTDGLITGYYEPLLNGSRTQTPRYAYPVYGTPSDLLFVEAKGLTGAARQWFRSDDRVLLPAVPGAKGAREYAVQLGDTEPGIRDKKFRVRVEGEGSDAVIVPYWSRQQIEAREMRAPVFAWVDDPYALYSMQIQGSGKIKLPSGELVRVAYGEQNGYAFLPRGKPEDTAMVASAAKTRGLHIADAPSSSSSASTSAAARPATAPQNAEVADIIASLKGRPGAARPATPPPRPSSPASASSAGSSDVAAMIAALKKPGPAPSPSPAVASSSAASASAEPATPLSKAGQRTDIPDPSYVFFRRIPDSPQGPLGALGVSLTAGRSIAVDPRTTPLGYPVFLSTIASDGSQKAGRLMFAQDTGGAIRGPVRADFFWGFGPQAGSQAAAMKESGRMWLLLPKNLQISAADPVKTRGPGGITRPAECVIADEDNCVEE